MRTTTAPFSAHETSPPTSQNTAESHSLSQNSLTAENTTQSATSSSAAAINSTATVILPEANSSNNGNDTNLISAQHTDADSTNATTTSASNNETTKNTKEGEGAEKEESGEDTDEAEAEEAFENITVSFAISTKLYYAQYLTSYLIEQAYQQYLHAGTSDLHEKKAAAAFRFLKKIHELKNQKFTDFVKKLEKFREAAYSEASHLSVQQGARLGEFEKFSKQVIDIQKAISAAITKDQLFGLAEQAFSTFSGNTAKLMIDQLYRLYLLPHQLFVTYHVFNDPTGNEQRKENAKATLIEEAIQKICTLQALQEKLPEKEDKKALERTTLPEIINTLELKNGEIENQFSSLSTSTVQLAKSMVHYGRQVFASAAQPEQKTDDMPSFSIPSLLDIIEDLRKQLAPILKTQETTLTPG